MARRVLSLCLVALSVACSSSNDTLLDSGLPADDAFDAFTEDPAVDAPDATPDARDASADVSNDSAVDAPADTRDASDVSDVSDAPDVLDVSDVSTDVRDASDASDVLDASDVSMDVRDGSDVSDVLDASMDVRDVPDAPDVIDVLDVTDASMDVRDVSDVSDVSDVPDASVDVRDASDVVDAAVDAPADNGCGTLTLCGGTCVNTQTDVANCGACGRVCPGMDGVCGRRVCAAGVCGVTNLPAATSCGAARVCDGMGACVECLRGSDCASGICTANVCATATCSDGVRNGAETGVDCGGMCPACPVMVMLAGGTSGVLGATWNGTTSWSTVTVAGGRTVENLALTVNSDGSALGMMRYTNLGDTMDNRLRYTLWRAGSWSAFADLGPTVTTRGAPALVSVGTTAYAVFHGFDFNHYFAAWTSTAWSPVADATGLSGAAPGALSRENANPVFVFSRGLANELVSNVRTGTAWGAEQRIDGAATFDFNVSPAAVNLTATTSLAVWTTPGGQLRYAVRSAGSWSAAGPIPMALSSTRVALASTSGTGAVLAFRGTDGNLYTSLYAAGSWATPVRVATGITGSPAVAAHMPGATAELVFLDGVGRPLHTRLVSGVWSAPLLVGTAGFVSLALATGP